MTSDQFEMLLRLLAAVAAGTVVGYERSFHGRPAGIRTHALVSMASCVLMFVTAYSSVWFEGTAEAVRLDPTRMAQGIMTGIGFLGAGVIMKEGLTIRGLTTAASIWITSTFGILAGIGLYFPLVVSVVLTLGVLSVFRWIEERIPAQTFYSFEARFPRQDGPHEEELRALVREHGFQIARESLRVERQGRVRRHGMVIYTLHRENAIRLSRTLDGMANVMEFRVTATGD